MFDVRLRLMNDDGTPGRVLQTLQHSWTGMGARQLRFAVAGSEKLAAPFLVAVEYSTGVAYASPRDDLFIVDQDDADSIDQAGAVSFTAQSVFGWLAARYALWSRPADTELERAYADKTPGFVLDDLIRWAQQQHGWAPHLLLGFNPAVDSAGAAWPERFSGSWPSFTTQLSRVVDSLTSQGYCEVWSQGFKLHAVAAGTGSDRTNAVTLGGPGFSRAPAKRVFDPATTILVQYDGGWTHFDNPGSEHRFGTVMKVMSQSGAPDRAAAEKNAQPALAEARAMQEELSYEWTVAGALPRPWVDFQIGDLVTARTRQGKKLLRVIGMDVSKDAKGAVTARVVVGSKILDFEAKLAKRAASVSVGTIIGGSGATPPAAPTPATAAPVPPEGVRVDANAGAWRPDGSASSRVTIAWSAVTQNVDGMPVDVTEHEVWARRASEAPSVLTRTAALSVTTDQFEPGVPVYLMVRARSRAGVWSAFSAEISVTPAVPASIAPKPPTGLSVVSNTGAFQQDGTAVSAITLGWTPVTLSVDGKSVTIDEYEVLYGLEAMRVRTASATITVSAGKQVQVTVRPLSSIGVWGDPSTPLNVTGALPTPVTTVPAAPVLTTGGGGVFVHSNGNLAGDVPPPSGFQGFFAETRVGSGSWVRAAGALARGAGQVAQVRAAVGATVSARLAWVDTLGRTSGYSAVTSVAVKGITVPDFDPNVDIAPLIQADSLLAEQIQMGQGFADKFWANEGNFGKIGVDFVTPNFGRDLDISASGSINLLAGGVNAVRDEIAGQQAELDAQAARVAANEAAAQAAANGASSAQVAAAAAAAAAASAQATADGLALAMRVSATDVRISRPGAAVALHLDNTSISFRRNGVVQTSWDESQMIVSKLKSSQLIVGSTVITEKPGGMTWQRLT